MERAVLRPWGAAGEKDSRTIKDMSTAEVRMLSPGESTKMLYFRTPSCQYAWASRHSLRFAVLHLDSSCLSHAQAVPNGTHRKRHFEFMETLTTSDLMA